MGHAWSRPPLGTHSRGKYSRCQYVILTSALLVDSVAGEITRLSAECPIQVPQGAWPPEIPYKFVHLAASDASAPVLTDDARDDQQPLHLDGVSSASTLDARRFQYAGTDSTWMAYSPGPS